MAMVTAKVRNAAPDQSDLYGRRIEAMLGHMLKSLPPLATIVRIASRMSMPTDKMTMIVEEAEARGQVQVWVENPDGPSAVVLPETARRLGYELDASSKLWVPIRSGAVKNRRGRRANEPFTESELGGEDGSYFDSLTEPAPEPLDHIIAIEDAASAPPPARSKRGPKSDLFAAAYDQEEWVGIFKLAEAFRVGDAMTAQAGSKGKATGKTSKPKAKATAKGKPKRGAEATPPKIPARAPGTRHDIRTTCELVGDGGSWYADVLQVGTRRILEGRTIDALGRTTDRGTIIEKARKVECCPGCHGASLGSAVFCLRCNRPQS